MEPVHYVCLIATTRSDEDDPKLNHQRVKGIEMMSAPLRGVWVLAMLASLSAIGFSHAAQEPSSSPSQEPVVEKSNAETSTTESQVEDQTKEVVETLPTPRATPYRRLPDYFGKVGVTEPQRLEIYQIRGQYRSQVMALERQIARLKQQEMQKCEAILSDAQRELLEQFRVVRQSASGTTTPPKPAPAVNNESQR